MSFVTLKKIKRLTQLEHLIETLSTNIKYGKVSPAYIEKAEARLKLYRVSAEKLRFQLGLR